MEGVGENLPTSSQRQKPCWCFNTDFAATHSNGCLCPIFNLGDQHDLENYPGITVSTVLSKLYATVLERRISGWAEEHGLRAVVQAGFRPDHRTTDNIIIMRTLIESCKAMTNSHQLGRMHVLLTSAKALTVSLAANYGRTCPALEYKARCLMH